MYRLKTHHLFYGEGIFLTLSTCKPTDSKSLFSIKSRLGEKLLTFLSVLLYI